MVNQATRLLQNNYFDGYPPLIPLIDNLISRIAVKVQNSTIEVIQNAASTTLFNNLNDLI